MRLTFTVEPVIFNEGLRRIEAVLNLAEPALPLTPYDKVSFEGHVRSLSSQLKDVRLECCN